VSVNKPVRFPSRAKPDHLYEYPFSTRRVACDCGWQSDKRLGRAVALAAHRSHKRAAVRAEGSR
jgi:hypothetical protein